MVKSKSGNIVLGRESKQDQVFKEIHQSIADGSYPVGTLLPKEQDFANILGVGRNTLRAALMKLKDFGCIHSRHRLGWEVLSSSFSSKEQITKKTIVICSDTGEENIKFILPALKEFFKEYGYKTSLHIIDDSNNIKWLENDSFVSSLNSTDISGVFFLTPFHLPLKTQILLSDQKIPVCVIGLQDECDYDTIANNRAAVSEIAIDYLVKKGHKNILYISVKTFFEDSVPTFIAGKLGYENAMLMNNLSPTILLNPENIWYRHIDEKLLSDALRKLKKKNQMPTAILASTALINEYLVPLLDRCGYKVPDDISLISSGENYETPSLYPYGIKRQTVLVSQYKKVAKVAVDTMLAQIDKRKTIPTLSTLKPILIEGDTVKDLTVSLSQSKGKK